jgi:exopolyphosphatase/guanosine-5'-triphosphate,3'-diphosphate pyrophosphatase
MPQGSFAAIDLGSNTVRLLVADDIEGAPDRRLVRQEASRLSRGLRPGRRLAPEAVRRTWAVLENYRRAVEKHGVVRTLLGATMAVRQAADGRELLGRVQRELGFDARLLSGHDEARLTAAGVMVGLAPRPRRAVIFDLGGRSTEFVLWNHGHMAADQSLDLGAVGLTEVYLPSDPPSPAEVEAAKEAIGRALADLPEDFRHTGGDLVGTAGTTTTLAAMLLELEEYRPEAVQNMVIERRALERLMEKILAAPTERRAQMPGLPADRADIIPAGALIVKTILDDQRADSFIVSDTGLLEGLWLAAARRLEL